MGRGILGEPKKQILSEKTSEEYQAFVSIQVVPFGQLYGGKICAALDRQHPRDLFMVLGIHLIPIYRFSYDHSIVIHNLFY